MPATFNQKQWTIYMPKDQYGDSPNSPQSPTAEIATSKHNTAKTASLIAAGGLAAQSIISLARTEIGASTGDEVLQNRINNGLLTVAYGAAILKGGPLVAVGLGIKAVADSIRNSREFARQNQSIEFDRKLLGKRVHIGGVSAYD